MPSHHSELYPNIIPYTDTDVNRAEDIRYTGLYNKYSRDMTPDHIRIYRIVIPQHLIRALSTRA